MVGYHNMTKMPKLFFSSLLWLALFFNINEVSSQQITLSECVQVALQNHPDVKNGYLQTGLAKVRIDQAKSNFMPEMSAGIYQAGNFGRSIDRFTNSYINQFYNSTWAGVNLNIPLFTSFRNSHLLSSARSTYLATEQAQANAKMQTTQTVIAAYLNSLTQYESINNALKQLKNDSIQYHRLTVRKSVGLTTKTEELQLLNQQKADELALVDAQLNYELSIVELSTAINRPLPKSTQLTGIEVDKTMGMYINQPLNMDLPQLAASKWRRQALDENIKATKALAYPTIGLSANYGTFYASSNPDRNFSEQLNDTRNGSISVSLSIPILRSLQTRPQVQELKLSQLILQNDLDKMTLQLNQALSQAKTRYQHIQSKHLVASELLLLSEQNMQLIQEQLEAGTAMMVDFLLAQNNLNKAQSALTQTKYQLIGQELLIKYFTTSKFEIGE
jgi:outer membrane protein